MCPDDGFHGRWTEKRLREEAIGDLPFAILWEAVSFTCRRELTLRPLTDAEKIDYLRHHPELSVPDNRLEDQRVTLEMEAMYEWLVLRSTAGLPVQPPKYTPSDHEIHDARWYAIAAELSSIDNPTSKFRKWLDELDDEKNLRDYLCHMLDHCPWLSNDWERPEPATPKPMTTAVAVQLLEQVTDALRVLSVMPKEAKEQQRNTVRRASPALSLMQFGKALLMDYRVFTTMATDKWDLQPDKDLKNRWTIDYNLLNDPGKEQLIEEHAARLRALLAQRSDQKAADQGKQKKLSAASRCIVQHRAT